MAYKFQLGAFKASGSIEALEGFDANSQAIVSASSVATDALATDQGTEILSHSPIRLDGGNALEFGSSNVALSQNSNDFQLEVPALNKFSFVNGADTTLEVEASGLTSYYDLTMDQTSKALFGHANAAVGGDGTGALQLESDAAADIQIVVGADPRFVANSTGIELSGAVATNSTLTANGLLTANNGISLNDASGIAGDALEDNGSGALRVADGGITNTMLSGNITPEKLATGAGLAEVGGALEVSVDDSSIEKAGGTLNVKALGITNGMLSGSIEATKLALGDALDDDGGALAVQVDDSSIEVDTGNNVIQVKDGGITNDMLSGSIANGKLANSTISGVSLGSNLNSLSADAAGAISVTSYNGSAAVSDLSVNVDDSSIEIDANAIQVKALGITNGMLSGAIANAKLANSDVTIGSTAVALGSTQTSFSGLTGLDFTAAPASIGASIGANALTLGGSTSTVIVAGDLTVQGSTTTVDSTTINISSSFTFEGPVDAHQTILDAGTPVADTTVFLPELSAGTYYIPAFEADPAGDSLSVTPAELNLMDADSAASALGLQGADGVIIFDSSDSDAAKKVLVSDIADLAGRLASASKADGNTLSEGMNFFADLSADAVVSLPASPEVGTMVYVKAKAFTNGAGIIVNRAGSQLIDGQASILLESDFAAVTLVYVASNDWRIV